MVGRISNKFQPLQIVVAFLLQYAQHVISAMGKVEYFSKVIKVVAELTEVSEEAILGKSREYEVVDARWTIIYLMKEKGYTTKQISFLMKHPVRTINHAINSFKIRAKSSSSSLGNTLEMARQQLSNNG